MHRASRDDSLHSNKSLTLYRNYQRTVLDTGVALLLTTSNHHYQFITAPAATPAPGILTDGLAYSQTEGCVHLAKSDEATRIQLNLTTAAEKGLVAPFRLAAGFRAYFLHLGSDGANVPDFVSVECTFGWTLHGGGSSRAAKTVVLAPVTKFPSKGKMVIYDTHILDDVIEATTCDFTIENKAADVFLAEIEVYE